MIPSTFNNIIFANNVDCKYSIIKKQFNIKNLYFLPKTRFFLKLNIKILKKIKKNIV